MQVALLVPWLSLGEQKLLYPDGISFAQPDDQVGYLPSPLFPVFWHVTLSEGVRTIILITIDILSISYDCNV